MLKFAVWAVGAISLCSAILGSAELGQVRLFAIPVAVFYGLCAARPRDRLSEGLWQASFHYGLGLTVLGPWWQGSSLYPWLPVSAPLVLTRLFHQSTPRYSLTTALLGHMATQLTNSCAGRHFRPFQPSPTSKESWWNLQQDSSQTIKGTLERLKNLKLKRD